MDPRAWLSGASGSPPSAPGSPSTGYPTGGNPLTNTPPTNPGPYWFHQLAEELRAVIVAGGLTPSQGTLTQLLSALQALFGTLLTSSGVPYGIKLGSLIMQWKSGSADSSEASQTITFGTAFPTACVAVFVSTQYATGASDCNAQHQLVSFDASGATVFCQNDVSGFPNSVVPWVLAFGY